MPGWSLDIRQSTVYLMRWFGARDSRKLSAKSKQGIGQLTLSTPFYTWMNPTLITVMFLRNRVARTGDSCRQRLITSASLRHLRSKKGKNKL
jgi:hypothetical protein